MKQRSHRVALFLQAAREDIETDLAPDELVCGSRHP
jgi:hypothetical protein